MLIIHHTPLVGEAEGTVTVGRQCDRIPPSEGLSTPSLNGQPHEAYAISGGHSEFYIPRRICNM